MFYIETFLMNGQLLFKKFVKINDGLK